MHILLLAHFAGSPHHGMVFGHYYLAREWVLMGHDVTIVAASYSHVRFEQPEQSNQARSEIIDGINYVWLPTGTYSAKSGFGRMKSIFKYTFHLIRKKLNIPKPDLVICSSHHPFPIYSARRLARQYKTPLVYEVRDLWPLTLIELGGLSKYNPVIMLMQKAEDYAYRHSDYVVSVLPGAKDYMESRGMSPGKFLHIPNGVNLRDIESKASLPESHAERLAKLRNAGFFVIGYAGKTGLSNALPILIEAATLINDDKIKIVLMGSGPDTEKLKEMAIHLNLVDKIIFLDPVNKNQVQDFLDRVDVAFVGAIKSPLYRFGMSLTKLNDFMLAGKPIISAIEAPGDIVEESGAGISCAAESPEELAKAILKMKSLSPDERTAMGEKGKQWIIKNRDYKVLAEKFLKAVLP